MIGEAAKTQETSNFRNTVGSLKRLIGRTLECVTWNLPWMVCTPSGRGLTLPEKLVAGTRMSR